MKDECFNMGNENLIRPSKQDEFIEPDWLNSQLITCRNGDSFLIALLSVTDYKRGLIFIFLNQTSLRWYCSRM